MTSLKNKTVGLLGMAFKANIDDTRSSLSFKLKKLLETKFETSPPSLCTSFTKLDEMNEFFSEVIRNIVSISGLSW